MKRMMKWATPAFVVASLATQTLYAKTTITFDPNRYTVKTFTLNGQPITFRAFEDIVYVQNPVDTKYQRLNFYVPEAYYSGKSIGGYTAKTAPIFFPNEVGGYMPGDPGIPGLDRHRGEPNAAIYALSKGYIVAAPGARGRTTQDEKGVYRLFLNKQGKSPMVLRNSLISDF